MQLPVSYTCDCGCLSSGVNPEKWFIVAQAPKKEILYVIPWAEATPEALQKGAHAAGESCVLRLLSQWFSYLGAPKGFKISSTNSSIKGEEVDFDIPF